MESKATVSEIFNLIILDESGSMDDVRAQTIAGCNETINTIRAAQKTYAENQRHYVSIFVFQSKGNRPSRYLIKNMSANQVRHISAKDYEPDGLTPLNDAVGMTLAELMGECVHRPNAIGSVTIITDGEENDSAAYTTADVAQMVMQLKEKGWSFNFIGANINVEETARNYNIDNTLEFRQDDKGTREMFERERASRMRYYDRVESINIEIKSRHMSHKERAENLKQAARGYFEQGPRITPERIDRLAPGEIFVFGSNPEGNHSGGAARAALTRFGAIMGQGAGLQGQSYAIPTTGSIQKLTQHIREFIQFAKARPELKFLVTRIGCGHAGFSDRDMAHFFRDAKDVENISLPASFWPHL